MGRYICHKDGVFFEWSTVVDAPVTYGMTEAEMREHHKLFYGVGEGVDERIDRAIEKGTSSWTEPSLESLIFHNRAGPDEAEITLDEIMKLLHVPLKGSE